MSESYRQAVGRKVVSRATAHELGVVDHLLPTVDCQSVAVVVIGRGRKAQLVDWSTLSGFGVDAVMVVDESALRPPGDDRELRAANGKLELLSSRVLSELGNDLGRVDDVLFDPASGALESLIVAARPIPANAVLGAGSYAVVVAALHDPT
jgi:uncharacterized protein YrrD